MTFSGDIVVSEVTSVWNRLGQVNVLIGMLVTSTRNKDISNNISHKYNVPFTVCQCVPYTMTQFVTDHQCVP